MSSGVKDNKAAYEVLAGADPAAPAANPAVPSLDVPAAPVAEVPPLPAFDVQEFLKNCYLLVQKLMIMILFF